MLRCLLGWLWKLQGLTCREATHLAANAMDRPLTARKQLKLAMHGVLCSYCRNYRRHLRFARKCMRYMSGPDALPFRTKLPPVAASRIKKTLERQISGIE
jgi:hypothetical protein